MNTFLDFWPVLSGLIAIAAIGVAFRAEVLVRLKVIEEKVAVLFELFNKGR